MKVLDFSKKKFSIEEILENAQEETVLLKTSTGREFVVSRADPYSSEVELLRKNHEFLEHLELLKQNETEFPLSEVKNQLG